MEPIPRLVIIAYITIEAVVRYFSRLLPMMVGGIMVVSASAEAGAPMPTGGPAIPPAGFLGFCMHHLRDCAGKSQAARPVAMSSAKWRQIDEVQGDVNASIRPRAMNPRVWDYAADGWGDCNTFALTKRRELIARGWPKEGLLLVTAITERGEGHLALVAHTDQGDLVLDNRVTHVVDWARLPYRWISIQSPESPTKWLSIPPTLRAELLEHHS
jgi:predicted transglutaminase-like cysteine proteinase